LVEQELVAPETRRRLDVHILSMAEGGAGTTKAGLLHVDVHVEKKGSGGTKKEEISDVGEWKSKRSFFPRLKPFITV
jgi:hypothetical protein